MSSEENQSGPKIKVNDRRAFGSAENQREENTEKTVTEKPEMEQLFGSSTGAEKITGAREPEITFSAFVMSFATQALIQLGEMPPPPGVKVPLDPIAAKQMIDILVMLEKRTKGNLDDTESQFLTEVLHSLRMSFVRATQKKQ